MIVLIVLFGMFVLLLITGLILENGESCMDGIMAIVLFFIAIGLIPMGLYLNGKYCSIPVVTETELYAGYNDPKIEGSFFLIAGSISQEDTVFFWVDDNGVKSKHERNMSRGVFIEDGGNVLLETSNICREDLAWLFLGGGQVGKSEFHVPEGSIITMYGFR